MDKPPTLLRSGSQTAISDVNTKFSRTFLCTSVVAAVGLGRHRSVAFDETACATVAKAAGALEVRTIADDGAPIDVLNIVLVETVDNVAAGALGAPEAVRNGLVMLETPTGMTRPEPVCARQRGFPSELGDRYR